MVLPIDTSTVLLLFAPLLLPKLYTFGAQAIANLTQKPRPGPFSRSPQQADNVRGRRSFDLTSIPAVLLALYSAYSLVFERPFNYFISLGNVPVTAPASKIQAALAWRGLAEKYAGDLDIITSLDLRALYMHFGHANLVGCYRLLESVAPKDVLAYASVQLARTYILRMLVLAYSNRRWKNTILIASIAGFLYEVYSLATTDMRLPIHAADVPSVGYTSRLRYKSLIILLQLHDYLVFWRNAGFLCASIIVPHLPSRLPAKPLSPEESGLIQAVHALIQRQDMLQTRIRVVEAAILARSKRGIPSAASASHLSPAQNDSLKAWLRTIVDAEGSHSSDVQPSIKIEETLKESIIPSVKVEEVEQPENGLQMPKSESLKFANEAFTTAPVIIKRSNSEESLTSPSLSRSSSSSTPIDTPTPAMRRPMSMEITGAAASQVKNLPQGDPEDVDEDVDQPLNKRLGLTNRLTQSLGPSGSIIKSHVQPIIDHEEGKQHRRSLSMFGAVPHSSVPEPDLALDTAVEEAQAEDIAHAHVTTVEHEFTKASPGSAPHVETASPPSNEDRGYSPSNNVGLSLVEALRLPDAEAVSSDWLASQSGTSHPAWTREGSQTTDSTSHSLSFENTPTSTATVSEDEGWTTVLSKKAKHRTQ